MRSFEFARKIEDGKVVLTKDDSGNIKEVQLYNNAKIPEYSTKNSAAADFFCVEDVVVPSIWKLVLGSVASKTGAKLDEFVNKMTSILGSDKEESKRELVDIKPTMIHTGIKSAMEDDEVLELYNRSSSPNKLGLVLANSVGVVDSDYYNSKSNDGEIMFAYYNFKLWDTKLSAGDRVGQGCFKKVLRPTVNLVIKDKIREGGLGSTGR